MNSLILYKDGKMEFDDNEIEHGKFFVEGGILMVGGDSIIEDYWFSPDYDKDFLETIRPEYIKKSWPLKREYVQGWFAYKKTKPVKYTSSSFEIIDYR